MREARRSHAVSVVDFEDYADFCSGQDFTVDCVKWSQSVSFVDFENYTDFCKGQDFTEDRIRIPKLKLEKQYLKSRILDEMLVMEDCLLRRSEDNITDSISASECIFPPVPGRIQEFMNCQALVPETPKPNPADKSSRQTHQ